MTKCPQCGYDETQVVNQKLVSQVMHNYVDEKGVVVGLIASNEKEHKFANGKVVTRQDLWKPVETKEIKK